MNLFQTETLPYAHAYTMQLTSCANCKNSFAPPATTPLTVLTIAELWDKADELHTAFIKHKGILCGNPILAVVYFPTLLDNSIAQPSSIITAGGK